MKSNVEMFELDASAFKDMLCSVAIDNPRYVEAQFMKFFLPALEGTYVQESMKQYALYAGTQPVAGCVVLECWPEKGYACIAEIQAFRSGHEYGKQLIEELSKKFQKIWLLADYSAGSKLVQMYRSYGMLQEKVILDGDVAKHMFFTCECDVEKIAQALC